MRQISISTDVFSLIWSNRLPKEESEDQILLRILSKVRSPHISLKTPSAVPPLTIGSIDLESRTIQKNEDLQKIKSGKWWQVIKLALEQLGGQATLSEIYKKVKILCEDAGRHIPKAFEETIRGTLEDNCGESGRYKRVRDEFCMPMGRGKGIWSLNRSP